MAGQSGHNLKIAKHKLGCRLPFESSNTGDGYAAPGPCSTRKMTAEEIAKYGPPKPRSEENPFRTRLIKAINESDSPEEAADLLGITVGRLNQYLGFNGIFPKWVKNPDKETDDMPAIRMSEAEAQEKLPAGILENLALAPDSTGQTTAEPLTVEQAPSAAPGEAQREKPKTRLEIARGKLTKELYQELKTKLMPDSQIRKKYEIATDVLVQLKKELGIELKPIKPHKPDPLQKKPNNNHTSSGAAAEEIKERIDNIRRHLEADPARQDPPVTKAPTADLTIIRAIELRQEMTEDIASLNIILDMASQSTLSGRVLRMLETQRGIHQAAVDRINEVFNSTVVRL